MSAPQPAGASSNGSGHPGYLTGLPTQATSRKKGRRDKPYRKFHIPCLEIKPPTMAKAFIPPNPKPYVPVVIPDYVQNTTGGGKAAKKARRRARKRFIRRQAKAQAEIQARQAAKQGDTDAIQVEEDKKRMYREMYREIKAAAAEQEIERNIVKTRSMSKKAKEERRTAAKTQKEAEDQGVFEAGKKKDPKSEAISGGENGSSKKRKREVDEDGLASSGSAKKSKTTHKQREDPKIEIIPSPGDAGYDEAVAAAKAGKGKANDSKGSSQKRKRGDDDDRVSNVATKKIKASHREEEDSDLDSLFEFDSDEEDDMDASDTESVAPANDPISTLPQTYQKPESICDFPDEILERIVEACDPVSRTLLGLTSKRFGNLAIHAAAGFPIIRDRYGSDLERHRFMNLLHGWMNCAYSEAPIPITIAQQDEREKLKGRRLCYVCRKYLPISGKKCQYWKNCPKKAAMPTNPASQAAHDAEAQRRQQMAATIAANNPATPFAAVMSSLGALPKVKKQKPKAQEFIWQDEDWTQLSVGLVKSRERLRDIKHICPKCTLTVHTIHLGWPPETQIVRWLEEGNPAGGKMATGHEPLSAAELAEFELDEDVDEDMLAAGMPDSAADED